MNFQLLFTQSFALMTVFIYGCCGEILIEKSGHLNLGIPGIMSLGGLGGVLGELVYLNILGEANIGNINPFLCIFIPLLFSLVFAGLAGLLFSFFTVTLNSNQNVVGLILTTFGVAFTAFFLSKIDSLPMSDCLSRAGIYFSSMFFPGTTKTLNTFESLFLSYGFLTYFAILVAILLAVFLNKTKIGLNVRAVGENPSAADSCGISVNKYRYISTIVGSAIAGLGGLYILMDKAGGMKPASISIEPFGWLAVLLVIFSMWKPAYSIIGSFIFSVFMTLPNLLGGSEAIKEVFSMIPYIMTIIILILTSIIKFKDSNAPEGLGQSYFREDR